VGSAARGSPVAGSAVGGASADGAGLAVGEEKKIFEKFYRGSGARPGGTGLGLSIVKGIARAHRGDIVAENDPAGGAMFTIRVPVETGEAPA